MFNLIVAVISIALIAAMAAASIFYGGSAFGSGTAQAQASTLVNNGQQISGAQQLYMIDNSGNRADAISVLTPTYLQAIPTPPEAVIETSAVWAVSDDGTFAFIRLDTDSEGQQKSAAETVCEEVVAQGGADNVLLSSTLSGASTFGDGGLDLGNNQFACVINTGGSISVDGGAAIAHFVFKL